MRIAQAMLGKGFGGAERSFVDLCAALAARGHEVLALVEARGRALPLLRRIEGLEIAPLRVLGVWDPFARAGLRRRIRAFAPAIVQCHLARAAALAAPAARALGIPTLAKTHNYVDLKYYRAIDRLIPTTASQAAYLAEAGVAPARITLIPNFSRLVPGSRGAPAVDPPRLVAAGRFVPKKGFDVLLRALHRVRDGGGRPVELTLVGDGPERGALEAAVRELGMQDAVTFTGWLDDVAPVLRAATLFVLPSRDEPFGVVVLEAMALGVPIVATRTAGPLEILDERFAWLVAVDDAEALARAIIAALDAPDERERRAARAAARFTDRYSEAAVVDAYERVYAELLSEARAP